MFTCHSKAVNIQENPTASLVIAKVRKRSQLDVIAVKRLSTCSLGDMLPSDDCPDEGEGDVNVEEQFLYEAGGNIGES